MKKILAIVLALACVFGMMSCGGDPLIAGFKTAISATNPTSVKIDTKLETTLGDFVGEFNATYAEDGSATITYSYEKPNDPTAEGVTDLVSTVTGTVELSADGTYSDGGTLVGTVAGAGGYKLNLDESKMKNVEVNGNVLTATVEAANTEKVLGVSIAFDVEMTLTKGESGIVSLALAYTTTEGPATIVCTYQTAAAE